MAFSSSSFCLMRFARDGDEVARDIDAPLLETPV
jgi:hypothetical protein